MSHFTVLVIGDNVDEQLEKYDEQLETPEYERGVVTQKEINDFEEWYKEKGVKYTSIEDLYNKKGKDWNSNSWKLVDGVWKEFSTYNPKWDWYVIGGRWTGFFKPKPGKSGELGESGAFGNKPDEGYVDTIRKGDLDIEFMRAEAMKKAEETWGTVDSVISSFKEYHSWEKVRENMFPGQIDAARDFYHDQPIMKAFKTLQGKVVGYMSNIEDYRVDKETFVNRAKNSAISTFAIVKDGEWIEKGSMGWFGMSSDKMTQDEWDNKFNSLIDELPDDTILTVVDCHI